MIRSRSPIVHLGIRAASPFALVVGAYLLFAGHNRPGGGFAAGLVFGAVLTLRTVAGLQRPTHAAGFVASGVIIVAAIAALPLLWGDTFLDQKVFSAETPVFGPIKFGTALIFDVGVTAIVVGLVIALLDGLALEGAADCEDPSDPRDPADAADTEEPQEFAGLEDQSVSGGAGFKGDRSSQ